MKKIILALSCSLLSLSAVAGNVARGAEVAKTQACASCHGADYNKPIDPSYPKLACQHADYIEFALKAYKRGNGANGRNNALMAGQVIKLTNTDMADLGAYFQSLPSELVLKR